MIIAFSNVSGLVWTDPKGTLVRRRLWWNYQSHLAMENTGCFISAHVAHETFRSCMRTFNEHIRRLFQNWLSVCWCKLRIQFRYAPEAPISFYLFVFVRNTSKSILVTRGRSPFDQHQESWLVAGPDFLSMRRVFLVVFFVNQIWRKIITNNFNSNILERFFRNYLQTV